MKVYISISYSVVASSKVKQISEKKTETLHGAKRTLTRSKLGIAKKIKTEIKPEVKLEVKPTAALLSICAYSDSDSD